MSGRIFAALNTSEQLWDWPLPKGNCEVSAAGGSWLCPWSVAPLALSRFRAGLGVGTKAVAPDQRLDVCLGPCQDTGCFLPPTASGNAGAGCSGEAGLPSASQGQRRHVVKPNLESFRKGRIGFLLLLSSSLPDLGLWVPEKLRSGSSQREQLGPRPPSAARAPLVGAGAVTRR